MTEPDPVEATGPSTPVTFAVSANDSLDGALTATCADSGDTTYASGDEFPVGTTTLTCSATDIAGNVGTSGPFDVTVTDTTGPDITTSANLTESAVDADGAVVSYDPASATDLVDGAVDVTCLPASGSTFPLGPTTVECDAEDSRGNPSSESFTVTVQDDTDPIVSVPADITEEATGANGAAVEFTVSAEDNVDGALDPTCDYDSGDTFPLGPTTVSCSATDNAGNTGQNSFTITVEDTTAPSLTLPDDITEEATSASGAEVTFNASAHDLVDGDLTPTCTPASGETFPIGTTTVTCDVTDEAGNTDSDTFTVTVEDTTAPEVDVPDDIIAEATGSDGAVVTYDAATAEDIVDGTLTPSCAPASGSTFPLGETTVTCSVTDVAGNTGSNSFTVKVRNTTPPAVTVPANLVVGNTSPTGAADVTYSGQSAEDLVDGAVDVNCTPASGGFFSLGETTVTCSAEDAAGNSGSNTFTVEVQDWTEPVVTVPANITAEATSAAGATVTWIGVSAVDDVSGSVAATCDESSGSVFPLGLTTVTCTAEDVAGNVGDNSFTVTSSTPPRRS